MINKSLRKSNWSLFVMMVVCFLSSCTIQKRLHTKGYYVDFRKSAHSDATKRPTQLDKQNRAGEKETIAFQQIVSPEEKIHENSTIVQYIAPNDFHTNTETVDTLKRNKSIERIINFSEQLNDKFSEEITNDIFIKKDELMKRIPLQYKSIQKQKAASKNNNFGKDLARGLAKGMTAILLLAISILLAVATLIVLVPAIVFTVLAKGNPDETKARKQWVSAWVCWGLAFLFFLCGLALFLIVLNY